MDIKICTAKGKSLVRIQLFELFMLQLHIERFAGDQSFCQWTSNVYRKLYGYSKFPCLIKKKKEREKKKKETKNTS